MTPVTTLYRLNPLNVYILLQCGGSWSANVADPTVIVGVGGFLSIAGGGGSLVFGYQSLLTIFRFGQPVLIVHSFAPVLTQINMRIQHKSIAFQFGIRK